MRFYFSLSHCTDSARFSSQLIQSERAYRRVWLSISAIYGVKWDHSCSPAPSLAEPLSQPPDSSRLAFSPRSPGPPLLFPPTFLSALPGAPLRILLRSRPLSPKAGPNPLHRSPWEFLPQRSRLLSAQTPTTTPSTSPSERWKKIEWGTIPFLPTDGSRWCGMHGRDGCSRWHGAGESGGVVVSLNSVKTLIGPVIFLLKWTICRLRNWSRSVCHFIPRQQRRRRRRRCSLFTWKG